ncbi:hypothetical protein MUP37_07880 [Candidatus Bathyarchaeota archaeon]|jgi:hypothetical protein|nr:hypothetical protein [Candidatus Bathyarchaeota archaeon]
MANLEIGTDTPMLDQIVNFCGSVQDTFGEPSRVLAEKRKCQRMLIDICRRCSDQRCPEECEVKKAYRTTL